MGWGDGSYEHWLKKHFGSVNQYVNTWKPYMRPFIRRDFAENPRLGKIVVNDFMENSEDLEAHKRAFVNFLTTEGHEIGVVSGSRRSGKTSSTISLIEEARKLAGIEPCFIGPPNKELEDRGYHWCVNIGEMKSEYFGFFDETALFLKSRRAMSGDNINVLDYLPTLSHTDVEGLMFLTQSTKQTDVGILDWADWHIVKNYTGAYGIGVERDMVENMEMQYLAPRANYVIPSHIKAWNFVRNSEYQCLMYLEQVPWYSDKVGKAFSRITNDEQAIRYAIELFEHDFDAGFVKANMKVRWRDIDVSFWKKLKKKVYCEDDDVVGKGSSELDKLVLRVLDGGEQQEYYEDVGKGKV